MSSETVYSREVTTEETDSVGSFRLIEASIPLLWRQKHHCSEELPQETSDWSPLLPAGPANPGLHEILEGSRRLEQIPLHAIAGFLHHLSSLNRDTLSVCKPLDQIAQVSLRVTCVREHKSHCSLPSLQNRQHSWVRRPAVQGNVSLKQADNSSQTLKNIACTIYNVNAGDQVASGACCDKESTIPDRSHEPSFKARPGPEGADLGWLLSAWRAAHCPHKATYKGLLCTVGWLFPPLWVEALLWCD